MPNYPDIYVLRHGQTEWNLAGRFQGCQDSPLTDLGVSQARQQGVVLAGLDLVTSPIPAFCSPQLRAVRTAKLAGLKASPDDRLMEVSFGPCEGMQRHEVHALLPEAIPTDGLAWHFAVPGGESFASMQGRCQAFLDDLKGPAIIVTHGITSRVLRGIWLGRDLDGMGELGVGQGCVYRLSEGRETVLAPPGS